MYNISLRPMTGEHVEKQTARRSQNKPAIGLVSGSGQSGRLNWRWNIWENIQFETVQGQTLAWLASLHYGRLNPRWRGTSSLSLCEHAAQKTRPKTVYWEERHTWPDLPRGDPPSNVRGLGDGEGGQVATGLASPWSPRLGRKTHVGIA